MWSTRKRKHDASPTAEDVDDHLLHVQAYEADIRCNPTSAKSLEVDGSNIGEALIKHPTGELEIWFDRYVGYIPSLRNPVRSVYPSGTVTDILLTSTLGLSCVPPSYPLFSLPWRDPRLLVVPQIRCTPHIGLVIHWHPLGRTAVGISIRLV